MSEWAISDEIYKRYYIRAQADGMVWTIYDWAVSKGYYTGSDYDFDEELLLLDSEYLDTIKKLMTLEISLYVFRRLNGPWGEVIDSLKSIHMSVVRNYFEKYNIELSVNDFDVIY